MFQTYVQGINKLTRLVIARYKMEWIYIQNLMKGQGSLELAMEILKKERKKERKIDNLRFYKSLVHAYSTVFMNDLELDRKVFCRSSRLQSYKIHNFTCSELFCFL